MQRGVKIPPGFQFSPTDEALVGVYLTNRVKGLANEWDFVFPSVAFNRTTKQTPVLQMYTIPTLEVYAYEPWELPSRCLFQNNSTSEWFFFSFSTKKFFTGWETNNGCWKLEKYRPVLEEESGKKIGMKKTLVYYKGSTPGPYDQKTDWVIHEYRLAGEDPEKATRVSHDRPTLILCKVERTYGPDVQGDFPRESVSVKGASEPETLESVLRPSELKTLKSTGPRELHILATVEGPSEVKTLASLKD